MNFNLPKAMFWTLLSILILTLIACRAKTKEEFLSQWSHEVKH